MKSLLCAIALQPGACEWVSLRVVYFKSCFKFSSGTKVGPLPSCPTFLLARLGQLGECCSCLENNLLGLWWNRVVVTGVVGTYKVEPDVKCLRKNGLEVFNMANCFATQVNKFSIHLAELCFEWPVSGGHLPQHDKAVVTSIELSRHYHQRMRCSLVDIVSASAREIHIEDWRALIVWIRIVGQKQLPIFRKSGSLSLHFCFGVDCCQRMGCLPSFENSIICCSG